MKKLSFSLILVAIAATGTIAQNGAMVDYKLSSPQGASGDMTSYYSSAGSRIEMKMKMSTPQMPNFEINKTSIVKSGNPNTVCTLDDKNKTYTVTETKKPENAPATGNKPEDYTVKIVGKEKVGNYNCTHATVTKGTQISEFWTTTEITGYEAYYKTKTGNKFMGGFGEYEALEKNGAGGFIVKTLTKDPRGGTFTMELVKIEKKDVAASLFEVPAGYTEMTSTPPAVPGMPNIDITKLQNMTPEERAKYVEDMKKQYGTPPAPPTPPKN